MQVRDPIVELHDTQLYRVLADADPDYASRITTFVEVIAPILATTERHFPYYTRHDAHHGFRVARRVEQVVEKSCFEADATNKFTPVEIFLLIAAAYAHDLGMTVFPDEADRLLLTLKLKQSSGWETDPALQAYLRREHSKRGGSYILQNADKLKMPVSLVNALDTMMKAHNFSVAELEALDAAYAAQERQLDIRQLAAIVCIGDALEFSDTRVIEGVLDRIKIDPSDGARVSYRENMKHVCVGDSLAVNDDGRVIVSGTFSEPEVLALAHVTVDQMEEWVQGYCDIDRRSMRRRLAIRPEPFLRNLVFTEGRFERLGVRLNKRSVIDLIASNAVWRTNAGIAIRELVQNAVEACRFRAHHSARVDRYLPGVRVEFDRTNRTVTVQDNGCGMSERTILNNFLTVGSSRSKEVGYLETDYAPIARFGVGFWSVFTIADKARIETAAFEGYRGFPAEASSADGIAFEVSLDELKDYTVFQPVTRPCGTRIVLNFRDAAVFDDIFEQSKAMLLCSEIPVTLVIDSQEIQVPMAVPDVSDTDILGARNRVMEELGVQIFRWRGSLGETELTLGLAYRMEDGRATFLADPSSSLMTAIGGHRYPRTSICGFSVPIRPDSLCIDLMRVGTFHANHRTPKGFEFSLDRQQLLQNEASERFARDITELFHNGYREFLAKTNSRDPAIVADLRDHAQMHGGNVYDVFTGAELTNAALHHPDLLCFRLFPVNQTDNFNQSSPIYIDLSGIRRLTGTVFTLQKRADIRIQGASFISFNPEEPQALGVVYEAVRAWIASGLVSLPAYVIEANRLGSMLFDADPESSVRFVGHSIYGQLCIQAMRLERASFNTAPSNIMTEIQGRWTGTIYLRTFNTPNGKPYLFLGRHRVLVERSSRLAQHLQELVAGGRRMRVAQTIAHLQEDEQGYMPEEIRDLLSS